jgi:hypothetical protein
MKLGSESTKTRLCRIFANPKVIEALVEPLETRRTYEKQREEKGEESELWGGVADGCSCC